MSDKLNPVVVDLGKVKKKAIKALKQGDGKLLAELEHTLQDLRTRAGAELEGKELVPIVLLYKEKRKRRKSRGLFGM